jgi:hypothetical protein
LRPIDSSQSEMKTYFRTDIFSDVQCPHFFKACMHVWCRICLGQQPAIFSSTISTCPAFWKCNACPIMEKQQRDKILLWWSPTTFQIKLSLWLFFECCFVQTTKYICKLLLNQVRHTSSAQSIFLLFPP